MVDDWMEGALVKLVIKKKVILSAAVVALQPATGDDGMAVFSANLSGT